MLYVDENQELTYAEADEELQLKSFFGEVRCVYMIRMPKARELGIRKPETVVLVEIQPCNMEEGPGKLRGVDIHLYYDMKAGTEIVDLTTVRCLIGRFKWDRMWAVFDRSGTAECMASD